MHKPHSFGPSTARFLTLCCTLALLAGGFWKASMQTTSCPTNENQSWGQGKTVYLKFATSITDAQKQGIIRGMNAWNDSNKTNNSRVTFTTATPPTGTNVPTMTFQSGGASGSSAAHFDPYQVQSSTGPVPSSTILNATVTFYTAGQTVAGRAIHDPSATNYIDFIQKLTVHEIGHSMGLTDAPTPAEGGPCAQTDGASVMNGYCGQNDEYGNLAMTPTDCDKGAVNEEYPPPPPGGTGEGGGGEGGGGDGGGAGGGDPTCTPQYIEGECGYDGSCDEWDTYTGTCTVYPGYDYCSPALG